MSTPLERAHLRLLSSLPVRTHYWRAEMTAAAGDRRGRQLIPPHHKAGRPIRVRGRKYTSVSAAARAIHVHARQIYKWLREGKAQYV